MDACYLDVQEGEVVRRVPLRSGKVVIGRQADCAISVADTLSSRQHCVVEKSPAGTWKLVDLKSRNGTTLNGRRVETAVLKNGDVIRVGAVLITYVDPMAEEVGGTYSGSNEELINEDDLVEDDLVEADDGEIVSEDDLVEGFEVLEAEEPAPVFGRASAGATAGAGRAEVSGEGPEAALEGYANALPDGGFGEDDISLINSRGQITHVASSAVKAKKGRKGKREAIDLFRLLLLVCMRSRATDIHIEPRQDHYGIRLRVDGIMVDVARLDSQVGLKVSTLVKVLSDLDIAQRNALQEGHFSSQTPSRTAGGRRRVDYRVSFAPSVFGQKVVVRILDAENAPMRLADLQLPRWMARELGEQIQQDSGMVIVAGPTGSGKTTTLYSLLRTIDLRQRNAVTIEDPVEMQLEGTTQMPVDEGGGKGFGTILRSVLRQDPDVIMVGEIRDAETARTAMQAAITGHMVLSTIHTRDTLGTVFRLLDLGVEPYLVSQGLNIVVAQRLVRQLCPQCRKKTSATADQKAALAAAGFQVDWVFVPGGCGRCLGTGHLGRRGVFELLRSNDALKAVIQRGSPSGADLLNAMAGTPFVPLLHTGFQLVAEGNASWEEITRIADRDGRMR